jgi:hypothetical protein
MMKIMPKAEIYRRMDRFWKDQDKTLSIAMFAELCGLSETLLKRVFYVKDLDMSEHTQICVSRALDRMTRGDVMMVYDRDRRRKLFFKQTPQPRLAKSMSLTVEGGQIGLKIGVKNKADYSMPSFEEQFSK